jgi:hypothetical protein
VPVFVIDCCCMEQQTVTNTGIAVFIIRRACSRCVLFSVPVPAFPCWHKGSTNDR